MASALEALLGASKNITGEVYIPRLKAKFTIKPLSTEELLQAEQEATVSGKVNDELQNAAIVARGCIDPKFSDKTLRDHYDATDSADCVKKSLLSGEVVKLMQNILKLSGYNNEEETIEEAKN